MTVGLLIITGLIFGSFINALVWRVHEQSKSSKKLSKKLSILKGKSMCPDCEHELAPNDLIPIISWITLKGKCRYCHESISIQYPLVELSTALMFLVSYLFWPYELDKFGWILLINWLATLVLLIALAVYDLRWYLLPNKLLYPLLVLVATFLFILAASEHVNSIIINSIWGIAVGGGIYYVIFQISDGKWIGGGDVKLGAVLGLLVGGPVMAFLMLFLSSLLGSFVALPLIAIHKAKRTSKLPYGPFLIAGAIIVLLFGQALVDWYTNSFLYL